MTFTIPNLLSILRMGLVPLFIIAIVDGKLTHALGIFVLAGLTDLLDGLIARFWHQQSLLGAYLDPIADKILLISAYATLSVPSLNPGAQIPLWVAILVIARDVLILIICLIMYLALGVSRFPPTLISKATTVVQIATVFLVLLAAFAPPVETAATVAIYLTALLTVLSGFNYVFRANRMAVSGEETGAE